MKIKNQFIHISFALALVITFTYMPLHAADAQQTEQVTASCNCPKPVCHMKALICFWHALKASIAFPAILLSCSHLREATDLVFSDDEQSKAIYQFTNCAATSYFAYILLKSAYEGIKKELFEDATQPEKDLV